MPFQVLSLNLMFYLFLFQWRRASEYDWEKIPFGISPSNKHPSKDSNITTSNDEHSMKEAVKDQWLKFDSAEKAIKLYETNPSNTIQTKGSNKAISQSLRFITEFKDDYLNSSMDWRQPLPILEPPNYPIDNDDSSSNYNILQATSQESQLEQVPAFYRNASIERKKQKLL